MMTRTSRIEPIIKSLKSLEGVLVVNAGWARLFDQPLVGVGAPQRTRFTVDTGKAIAVIARTNAVVFEEAVAFLDLNRRFHFVGGTEGDKLEKALDACRLWVGERGLMRDAYLRRAGCRKRLRRLGLGRR